MLMPGKSFTRHVGKATNFKHFTGKKTSKRTKRKGTTHKQRKMKRGSHVNKYE